MDASNTIEFVLTGKVKSVYDDEMLASIVWQTIENHRSAIQNFVGFRPLRDMCFQKTGGGVRDVRALPSGFTQRPVFDTQCRELTVFEDVCVETKKSTEAESLTKHHKVFLVLTRDSRLLLTVLNYIGHIPRQHCYEEKVTDCPVADIDRCQFVGLFGGYKEGGFLFALRMLETLARMAEESHRRRVEMAEKDLATAGNIRAIRGRMV